MKHYTQRRESTMRKILRTQRSAHILSVILCLLGTVAISFAVWKTWPQVSAAENPFSTFVDLLWSEKLDLMSGLEFTLMYLFIFGDVMLIVGVATWVLSRQWFLLPGKTVWYRCPFCKKKWKSTEDKALVHCPRCLQLVHPTLTEE